MKIKVNLKQNRKVIVGSNTSIGRVSFNKVARIADEVSLRNLNDVNTSFQKDGDVLVYQANTNSYVMKTLPRVDGGEV